MEFILLLLAQSIFAIFVLIGYSRLSREIKSAIKKDMKDQQEVKTRLTWIKKRQNKALKK